MRSISINNLFLHFFCREGFSHWIISHIYRFFALVSIQVFNRSKTFSHALPNNIDQTTLKMFIIIYWMACGCCLFLIWWSLPNLLCDLSTPLWPPTFCLGGQNDQTIRNWFLYCSAPMEPWIACVCEKWDVKNLVCELRLIMCISAYHASSGL